MLFLEILQYGKAVHVRQPDVEDYDVGRLLHVLVEPVGSGQRGPDGVAFLGQIQIQGFHN